MAGLLGAAAWSIRSPRACEVPQHALTCEDLIVAPNKFGSLERDPGFLGHLERDRIETPVLRHQRHLPILGMVQHALPVTQHVFGDIVPLALVRGHIFQCREECLDEDAALQGLLADKFLAREDHMGDQTPPEFVHADQRKRAMLFLRLVRGLVGAHAYIDRTGGNRRNQRRAASHGSDPDALQPFSLPELSSAA